MSLVDKMKFGAGQIAKSLNRLNDGIAIAAGVLDPSQLEEVADKIFRLYCEVSKVFQDRGCEVEEYSDGILSSDLPLLPIRLDHLHKLSHEELNEIQEKLDAIETILSQEMNQ